MNILDFVLNWILNWIIFRPDSMKKWIFITDRPGLNSALEYLTKSHSESDNQHFRADKRGSLTCKTKLWRQQVQVGDCDRITETPRMRRVEVHHLREYRVKSTLSNLITNLSLDRINTGYTQILSIPSQLWKYNITQSRQFLLGWPPTSLKSDHNPVLCPLTQVTHHHSCIFFAISNNWLFDVCGFLKRQSIGGQGSGLALRCSSKSVCVCSKSL